MRTSVRTAADRRTDHLLTLFCVLLFLVLLGITGHFDYEEARRVECSNSSQGYDPSQDVCLPR